MARSGLPSSSRSRSRTGRPATPPRALASSTAIRIPCATARPWAASTPVRELISPTTIGSAARAGAPSDASARRRTGRRRRGGAAGPPPEVLDGLLGLRVKEKPLLGVERQRDLLVP